MVEVEDIRRDREAVRRQLIHTTLSVACLSITADVPAVRARAIVQELRQDGVVTETAGPCQLCGGVTLVYTAAINRVA